MSTRSQIARQLPSGQIESIYCHFDGYPSHHAPILLDAYSTEERVKELLDLGNLSILGPEIGQEHDFDSHIRKAPDSWCLFYGRDRHEPNNRSTTYIDERAFLDACKDSWADFLYLFQCGRWAWRTREATFWRQLTRTSGKEV
jgi:hypothetical protein